MIKGGFHFLSVAVSILILSSCTSTKLIGSWQESEYEPKDMRNVLVVGMTRNASNKQLFEVSMAEHFQDDSVRAVPMIAAFPSGFPTNEETKSELIEILRERGLQYVLVMSVLDISQSTNYVYTGSIYYPYGAGYNYYRTFDAYYYSMAPMTYQMGYTTTTTDVKLECNLYDMELNQLVWTGQTQTIDPYSIQDFAREYTELIYNQLQASGVIKIAHPQKSN